ncbi:MAG: membrane protein insertase YidC [Pseudomonadota bacterium]
MDIKRTVLWVVFSLSLLILWDNWMRASGKPSMFFPTATSVAPNGIDPARNSAGAAGPSGTGTSVDSVPQMTPGVAAVPPVETAPAARGEIITVVTDLVSAQIDTAGGELKRLELLKHKDGQDQSKNMVLFDSSPARTYLAQTGLIGGPFPNHKTAFTARPGVRSLDSGNQVQVILDAEQGGLRLTKTYTFKRGEYAIDVRHDVTNLSTAPIVPALYMQLLRDGSAPAGESFFYSTFTGPAVYTSTDFFQKITFEEIEKGSAEHTTKANNGWIALIQHYFVSAFIPGSNKPREIFTKKVAANLYAVGTIEQLGSIAPGATITDQARLYSGPQESLALQNTAPGLDLVKDYGILKVVAEPIFWLMTQIHKLLGNWGWTIIVLTVLIKLVFFPLSAASYRSMGKMKLVTPKMTAIRERHKGDPAKMNQAMMELYKAEKINPLGGCLPIVVQIPVFISLYWVLLASVEMRNAPWLGWIQDLAAPDPYYILPVIMAVSMFIQTKLNPVPPDPVQAKVMLFMPIIFSVMFFFFPSGLVLYWVVNNILSIAQQWVITKKIESGKPA